MGKRLQTSCEGEVGEKGCKTVAKAKWEKGAKAKGVQIVEKCEGEKLANSCRKL